MEMWKFICVILNFFSFALVENVLSEQSCAEINIGLNIHCFFDCNTAFCRHKNSFIECGHYNDGDGWCRIEDIVKQDLEYCDDVFRKEIETRDGRGKPHIVPLPTVAPIFNPDDINLSRNVSQDVLCETNSDMNLSQEVKPTVVQTEVPKGAISQSQVRVAVPEQLQNLVMHGREKEFEDLNKNCFQTCNGNEEICLYHQFSNLRCSVTPVRGGGRKQCRITPSIYPKCTLKQLWSCTDCMYSEPICNLDTGKCSRDGFNDSRENACFIEDTSDKKCTDTMNLNSRCASDCANHRFCQSWGNNPDVAASCGDFKHRMKRVGLCKMNPSPMDDFIIVNVENNCFGPVFYDLTYTSMSAVKGISDPLELGAGLKSFPQRIPADVSARVLIYDFPDPNVHKMERGLAEFTAKKSGKGENMISYDLSNVDSTFLPMQIYAKSYGRGTCDPLQCGSGSKLDMSLCPPENLRRSSSEREFCLSSAYICSTDYENNKKLCTSFDSAIADCKQNVTYCDLCDSVRGMHSSTSCTAQDVLSCTGYFAGHHPKDKGCAQENILEERDTPDCNYHGREICAMLNRKFSLYTAFVKTICSSAVSFSQDHWGAPHLMQHCLTNEVTVVACP